MMEWRFAKMGDDETREGSNLAEFFRKDVFKDFTDGLVREDVQNRLDAKRSELDEKTPVKIRFYLSGAVDNGGATIGRWLAPLKPHCNAKQCLDAYSYSGPLCCFDEPLRFLTIECRNTTGLKGNPAQCNEDEPSIVDNDFYWMLRNVGRSGKKRQKGKRGSWGIGKVVYQLASQANTIFCYSISKDGFALMGQAQLEPHKVDGQMYRRFGYFAEYDANGFPMPGQDISSQQVHEFKADFNITRADDELGTSTVIPFCREHVSFERLVISAIRSYLWELLKGHVEITIESGLVPDPVVLTADREKLKEYIDKYFPPAANDKQQEKAKFLAFADFYADIIAFQRGGKELKRFALKAPDNYTNVFDYKPLFESLEKFAAAKNAYRNGEIICVDANIVISKKNGEDIPVQFQVFLQKGIVDRPQVSLIRDGLTILKLDGHRSVPFCALTLIEKHENEEENPLSEFVRAAESPSHTDLKATRSAFENVYAHGAVATLKYILNLMWELSRSFTDVEGEEVEDAFDDLFPMDGDEDDGGDGTDGQNGGDQPPSEKPSKKKTKKKKKIKPAVPPIPHKKAFYRIVDPWPLGVKVVQSDSPAQAEDLPWHLQLKLAFTAEDVSDPIKKYDLSDFDCRQDSEKHVMANLSGCEIEKAEPNRLVFLIKSSEFSIELTGFGDKRDIFVDARKINPTQVEFDPSVETVSGDDEGDGEDAE